MKLVSCFYLKILLLAMIINNAYSMENNIDIAEDGSTPLIEAIKKENKEANERVIKFLTSDNNNNQ